MGDSFEGAHEMELHPSPRDALSDEPLGLRLTGVEPRTEARLMASAADAGGSL